MDSWRDYLPIFHKSWGAGARLLCAGFSWGETLEMDPSRDGSLKYELQMNLVRIFTIGYGSFSPLDQMSEIWDVYFLGSHVPFVQVTVRFALWLRWKMVCVVGRKVQVETALKVVLCRDKKDRKNQEVTVEKSHKLRKKKGPTHSLLCSNSLCSFASPLLQCFMGDHLSSL